MKPPCHNCKRWEGKCCASQKVWNKCDRSGTYSQFQPKELFTRGEMDTWDGILEGWGKCNFSVIGTYGDNRDPRIVINRAENSINCEYAAIDWHTGKVIKFFGNPNMAVEYIE